MKVKQNNSIRPESSELGMPPSQLTKCGILTLEESPVLKPLKLSSVKYVSPLGNVAQPMKKKKKKSVSNHDLPMPIDPVPDVGLQKSKAKSIMLPEHAPTNTSDVIVIQDTPEPMQNRARSLQKALKTQSHSIVDTDDVHKIVSELVVSPTQTLNKTQRRKKRRRALSDLHSDSCLNAGLESFMATDNPYVPKKKKKRHMVLDQEVNSRISNDPVVADDSPPKKKRKVLLLDDPDDCCSKKVVTINIENDATEDASPDPGVEDTPNNKTIDLESEFVDNVGSYTPDVVTVDEEKDIPARRTRKAGRSGLNNTIVLSDEEDTDDIIVLGSPVVPSVKTYKEINTLSLNPGWQPWSTIGQTSSSGSVIARAVSRLSQTIDGIKMNSNAPISGFPLRGSKKGKVHSSKVQLPSANNVPPSPANEYGSNLYNPSGNPTKKTGLRPVIIDGSNIAMGHGNGRVFSCRGIEICVNYFEKKGHKVFAFVPQFRRHNNYTKDAHILEKLSAKNTVIFTPSRTVNGKHDVPYDDRYIVQTAAELGGVIVSTDNYRDLLNENKTWHDVIKNRLLMFTWVEDLLIFPQDPLGRRGSNLETFLRFPN